MRVRLVSFEGWNNAAVPPSPQAVVRSQMRLLLWDLEGYLDFQQGNDFCDAGNPDGGSCKTCSHCIRQKYLDEIRSVLKHDEEVEG